MTTEYLARDLHDADGATVRPGDRVAVWLRSRRVRYDGVYLGVSNERDYPAVVRTTQGVLVKVWKSGEWRRIGENKQGDGA